MKKAIVTGATGFIGAVFVEFLTKNGIDVLALGRKKLSDVSSIRRKRLESSTYIPLDMSNICLLPNEIKKLGWVPGDDCVFFNLAWGGAGRLSDMDIAAQIKNVAWVSNALQTAAEIKCKRFIQVGTMEEAFTYKYLELDHEKNQEYNRHLIYSVAKIAAKNALKIKANKIKIELIYVLHSHVMGPDDDKDSFLQVTLQKLINNEDLVFSSGEQCFDVVSLFDCCNGYFLICQRGVAGEEYWVGSGQPKKLREYVERMYALFPSGKEMQFGKLAYNDIKLNEEDFSIETLVSHTGYVPSVSYEQSVTELYKHLIKTKHN